MNNAMVMNWYVLISSIVLLAMSVLIVRSVTVNLGLKTVCLFGGVWGAFLAGRLWGVL